MTEATIARLKPEYRAEAKPDRAVITQDVLQRIISPSARDRWMGQCARNYTPERVEQVLRSAISGNLVAQWELFDLMEDTAPRIQKNLNEVKRAVKAYDRQIEGWEEEDEPASAEADDRAKVVSRALWTMRPKADENQNGFADTVYDILDAWGKGIAVLEIDWEVRDGGKFGPIMAPKCTRWIHPRFYGFPLQQDWLGLNVAEIDQSVTLSGTTMRPSSTLVLKPASSDGMWARFPENKFLICKCRAKSGHPSVSALLRPLAAWWAMSNFTQEWFLNLAQIFGLPIRWATYDVNQPGLLDKIAEMLENMGSQAWGAFPAGTTLELKEAGRAGQDNPQVSLLDRAERQYDVLILGQTLTTTQGDRGSQALGTVHKTVRDEIIEAAAEFVVTVINQQLIPAIVQLNYGNIQLLPEVRLKPRTTEDTKQVADTFEVASRIGLKISAKHAYKRLGIPMPSDDEEVLQPRAPEPTPGLPANARGRAAQHVHARDAAIEKLIENGLEQLSGVEARWLAGLKPVLRELVAKAGDDSLSDADFVRAIQSMQSQWPEFFNKLDAKALEEWFFAGMGAAVVNGAVRGYLERRMKARKRERIQAP